jgi:acetoin utilization protein AcuB
MREGKLVGIITETDMFKLFLEMFGAREEGMRLSLLVPEGKGVLAEITAKIAEIGGNILALGTMMGEDPTNREIMVKVANVSSEALVSAMEELGIQIKFLDVRFCELPGC